MEMSKGDFATHIGVSAARISQYINDGIIGRDALVGEGRFARIDVEKARAQVAARRHIGQALANGLTTRVAGDGDAPAPGPADGPGEIPRDTAALIQLERLEQERRRNRQAQRDEEIENGKLVAGDELERQVARAVQRTVATFDGMSPDIANAIAAKFELPQRDVLHLIRQVMRDKRAAASAQLAAEAEQLPKESTVVLAA